MKTKSIYLRIFAAFFAAYLLLMLLFTGFFIKNTKDHQLSSFLSNSYELYCYLNSFVENFQDNRDNGAELDSEKFYEADNFANNSNIMYGIYDSAFNTYFEKPGTWMCGYGTKMPPAMTEIPKGYIIGNHHGYLDLAKWVSDEDYREIIEYLGINNRDTDDRVLAECSIRGFWVDGLEIIPKEIVVNDRYGNSSSKKERVYKSLYKGSSDLLYFDNVATIYDFSEVGAFLDLENRVRDSNIAKKVISIQSDEPGVAWYEERVSLFEYRLYTQAPYLNSRYLTLDSKKNEESTVWYVFGARFNFWDNCKYVLIPVWAASLIIVLLAGGVTGYMTSKTYRKQLALEQARRDMTNGIAHDLKTPLAAISGYAEMISDGIHSENREHYAACIRESVSRMDNMVCQMLQLSKLDSAQTVLRREKISLEDISRRVIKLHESQLQRYTIEINGDAEITADAELMERVIENFMSNAVHHVSESGVIKISISEHDWRIFNSGQPIPKENLKKIWDAYTKVDKSRSTVGRSGLGLFIVKTILDRHGFTYGVENESNGVTFWFEY